MLYVRFQLNFPFYFMQKLNICKHVINAYIYKYFHSNVQSKDNYS